MITDPAIEVALDTIDKRKQAIVFANSKRSAEKAAEDISRKIKGTFLKELSDSVLKALSNPTRQCRRLSACVEKGIAFHHAGLASKQREIIENNFRNGKIRIICSTPTLAAGLDMPAFRTIIKSLKRYAHWGMDWIPVLEYKQMSGRAGRPRYDSYGEAIIIAKDENDEKNIIERFIKGDVEEIYSKLSSEPVLRTYILSLVSSGFICNMEEIEDFFSRTLWAYQYGDMSRLKNKIESVIIKLRIYGFIESDEELFKKADNEKSGTINATLIGQKISELYLDPYTADHMIRGMKRCSKGYNTFGILQLLSRTLEMRPLLRTGKKEYDLVEEMLNKNSENLLDNEPVIYDPDYEEFLDSIKTASFFYEWIEEKGEDYLLEKYKIRPGEISAKLAIMDWLCYCMDETAKILGFDEIRGSVRRLRIRLKYGVKEELLYLLRIKGVGRVRSRKLYNAGIRKISDIKKIGLNRLSDIVGRKVAENILEEVGAADRKQQKIN